MASSFADELVQKSENIVQSWFETWHSSRRVHPAIPELELKDNLAAQLRLIGEQLQKARNAEGPQSMWKIGERLNPEARVIQKMPIEELVQEYRCVADTVRNWVDEREIDVSSSDYEYFYAALFELAAESARRYTTYQAALIRSDRAHYLAGVMHQLRTPLSSLQMQLDLLERTERRIDSASLMKLQRNVRRIRLLVDRILQLERFQVWEVPVRPQRLSPARLVDEIMSDHEAEAARKGLRFEAHVNRSLEVTIDPDLFIDSLGNLVQNAIKFTASGSVIVDMEAEPAELLFRVRDSGPGIPPEQQDSLFKQPQPGAAGGSGIGLQIAQHAARAQGGFIAVESKIGEGSVFSLHVPRLVTSSGNEQDS